MMLFILSIWVLSDRDEEGYIGNLGINIYPDLQSSIGSNKPIGLMRRIGTIVVKENHKTNAYCYDYSDRQKGWPIRKMALWQT